MAHLHRSNEDDAPQQPDPTDTYVVVVMATKLCTSSPLDSELTAVTVLVEATSEADAESVARELALGIAGDWSEPCGTDLPFEDAQALFARKRLLVPHPIVVRLSEVPAVCASCAIQDNKPNRSTHQSKGNA